MIKAEVKREDFSMNEDQKWHHQHNDADHAIENEFHPSPDYTELSGDHDDFESNNDEGGEDNKNENDDQIM